MTTSAAAEDSAAPAGFVRLPIPERDAFTALTGPFHVRFEGENLVMGFRVQARHSNPGGICHGGAMMTFADVCMGVASAVQGGLPVAFLPTISLSGDFLAPTPVGAWVEGRTQVLRVTKRFVFAQALATADGTPVLRTSGVFSVPRHPQFPVNLGEALRALAAAAQPAPA
jgi:uncharacterized protein (TIGR00369 family)